MIKFFNIFLVGRPNVGKSSLFNFLIGKNDAVVKDEEGTTCDWRSHKIGNLKIWDSPGTFNFEKLPVDADIIYFVIDNIVLYDDKVFYLKLKSLFPKVLVVINKIDKGEDFDYSFFEDYIKISLRSRFNIFHLKSLLMEYYKEIPDKKKKIWAIMGKPNVGKSSLINAFLKYDLHSVEDFEGTTKEFLPVDFEDNVLLDTPGQRHRANFPRYNSIFGIVIVTDLKNEKQDLRMINLAIERRKPVFLVVNKIDLINSDVFMQIKKKFLHYFNIKIVAVSCLKLIGLDNVLKTMKEMEDNFYKRIPTSVLNQWLNDEIKHIEPKLKFITQVEIGYPKFYVNCILVKDKEKMLKKRLAEKFNLLGIPMKIIMK